MFCSKCGTALQPGQSFCVACGNPVVPLAATPAPLANAPVVPNSVTPYPALGGVVITNVPTYAGFWLRLVAHLIDSLILSPIFIVLFLGAFVMVGGVAKFAEIAQQQRGRDDLDPAFFATFLSLGFAIAAVGLIIGWLYNAKLESGPKQATWGKQVLGLYVTDINGQRMTFGRASGRFFSKIISGMLPLAIGYIMAGFTQKKQALHDMIASTLVLRH